MKKLTIFLAIIIFPALVFADWNTFETKEETQQRHESERYQYRKQYGEPLGGYPEKLGDPGGASRIPTYHREESPYMKRYDNNDVKQEEKYKTPYYYPGD